MLYMMLWPFSVLSCLPQCKRRCVWLWCARGSSCMPQDQPSWLSPTTSLLPSPLLYELTCLYGSSRELDMKVNWIHLLTRNALSHYKQNLIGGYLSWTMFAYSADKLSQHSSKEVQRVYVWRYNLILVDSRLCNSTIAQFPGSLHCRRGLGTRLAAPCIAGSLQEFWSRPIRLRVTSYICDWLTSK